MNRPLPPGWVWASPEDVARRGPHALAIGPFGSNLKVADYRSSGVPLVFVRHIRAERFVDTHFISGAKAKQLASHSVAGGDVLITKMGEPPGDSAIYPLHLPHGIITADCIKWSIDPRVGFPKFFMYATRTSELRQLIIAITQGVAQKKVSLGRFKTITFPCAPRDEQERLVDALDSHQSRLDAAVASLERAQATLKAYRASVLKAAVEGRLVPTETELARNEGRGYEPADVLLARILKERRRHWEVAELAKMKAAGKMPRDDKWKRRYQEPWSSESLTLSQLPKGWTWARISMVGDVQLGRQRSPIHHHGIHMRPYLRVANVFEDRIDTSDVMKMNFSPKDFETYRLGFGDILLNEGQSPHLIGRPAMYRGEVPGACFQNTLIRFRAALGVDPRFALVVFRAQLHNRRYMRIAQITTNIAHLGAGRFAEIEFPLPPTDEQKRIADEVERLMSIADAVESSVIHQQARSGRLRQSILKWAFDGKLVDQDSGDEPAGKLLARIRAERTAAPAKKTRARKLKAAS